MNSALENTKHIYELVALCAGKGISNAVVCPGSRCAPLLLGFGKHPDIDVVSVTDERSAGFIALGLAQQLGSPVVLVCTSGTAAQNFAPAVTEAFYQNVPLIVLTADRPPEWIDQWDGQTIHQNNIYMDHIKGRYIFTKKNISVAEDALSLAVTGVRGPVHLNIPISEPFYPASLDEIEFDCMQVVTQKDAAKDDNTEWIDELRSSLSKATRVMLLGGQMEPNKKLVELLQKTDVVIVGDVLSNLHGVKKCIKASDFIASSEFAPDLLISFGRSIISKSLKLFLRNNKPESHWHIGRGLIGDPFGSLTKTIAVEPELFFREWVERELPCGRGGYGVMPVSARQYELEEYLSDFNYFTAVSRIIEELPECGVLHLGNSMPVRIADLIGLNKPGIDVWGNRGTSGIDGIVSTAVGHALADIREHILIVGDVSFFYDRNGLWLNNKFPDNLRIVILNDGGGGIFNIIDGPSDQGELKRLFTTPHNRTARLTAEEFGMNYIAASSTDEFEESLKVFKSGIFEIFTNMEINVRVFNRVIMKQKESL
jgi:2-succinyl-5-enolpyruvyl-6-hydroxy-3-cyclohexene-1-carboxylate synthase